MFDSYNLNTILYSHTIYKNVYNISTYIPCDHHHHTHAYTYVSMYQTNGCHQVTIPPFVRDS